MQVAELRKLYGKVDTMLTLRGTGRTTRMLESAALIARDGKPVYILVYGSNHRRYLQACCDSVYPDAGIKVETEETVGRFDWDTFRFDGMPSNGVVLVDHFLIESKFPLLVQALHGWDEVSCAS